MPTKTRVSIPVLSLADFKDYHLQHDWNVPPRYSEQLGNLDRPHFSTFSRSDHRCKDQIEASRLDFYKITFITEGTGVFTYGQRQYEIKPPALVFVHPMEVKAWQATSAEQDGYYLLFNEQFIAQNAAQLHEFRQYPYLQTGASNVLFLTDEQACLIQPLVLKLVKEFNEYSSFRQEILRLTLQLLMIEAKRFVQPLPVLASPNNAAYHLTQRFLELLEKQFPIETWNAPLEMKAPAQFADQLAVHANHLNACVKKTTGKTIRKQISGRVVREAQALLRYTDWRVSEIAYALGFEESASFIHFFRKETGHPPLVFRD